VYFIKDYLEKKRGVIDVVLMRLLLNYSKQHMHSNLEQSYRSY